MSSIGSKLANCGGGTPRQADQKEACLRYKSGSQDLLIFPPADFRRAFPDKSLWESCSSETDEAALRCRTGDSHGFRIAPLEPIRIHSCRSLRI